MPDDNHAVPQTTSTSKAKKANVIDPTLFRLDHDHKAKRVKTATLQLVTKDTSSFKKNNSASVNHVTFMRGQMHETVVRLMASARMCQAQDEARLQICGTKSKNGFKSDKATIAN